MILIYDSFVIKRTEKVENRMQSICTGFYFIISFMPNILEYW